MPFSAIDYATLSTHGFFNVYDNYRDRLVAHARDLYQRLERVTGIAPSISDCELLYEFQLPISGVFADIVADLTASIPFPKPQDAYWETFVAGPIARYVTDREWLDIIS
jgi:hypothetical protein